MKFGIVATPLVASTHHEHRIDGWRSKHVSTHGSREHALAHEASMGRLMAAASACETRKGRGNKERGKKEAEEEEKGSEGGSMHILDAIRFVTATP